MARPGSQLPINCPFQHWPWEPGGRWEVRAVATERREPDAGDHGDNEWGEPGPSDREVIILTCDKSHKKPPPAPCSALASPRAARISVSPGGPAPAPASTTGPGPTQHLVTRTLVLGLKPSAQGPRLNHARAQFSRNNSQVCSNIVPQSGSSDIICYIPPFFDQTDLERTKNSPSSDLNASLHKIS